MSLILKKGLSANRKNITPTVGELIFTTDTINVYVGDNVTPGGISINHGSTGISNFGDVNSNEVSNGSILYWNSINSEWSVTTASSINSNLNILLNLNNFSDVNNGTPSAGLPLIWSDTLSSWRPANTTDSIYIENLNSISDINVTGETDTQILSYNSQLGQWQNTSVNSLISLNILNNVSYNETSPSSNQLLTWNNSLAQWEPNNNAINQSLNTINEVSFDRITGDVKGSILSTNSDTIIDSVNAAVIGKIKLGGSAPLSNTSIGNIGEIRFDSDFIYVCTAQNTWKKASLFDFTDPIIELSPPSPTGLFAVNINYPSTLINTPYSDNVLNNDDGNTLSVSSWGTPTNGTLTSTNSDGSFTYTPNTDFVGNDSFSYELTDGTLTSTGLVFIVVVDVDDERPTVTSSTPNQTYTVGVEISPLDLSAAFSDDTGIEIVAVVFNPLPNGLTINTSTGVVTGTPSAGSEGTYNMRIWAYNINGLWTEDNFTITVNAA